MCMHDIIMQYFCIYIVNPNHMLWLNANPSINFINFLTDVNLR